jgi:hypothetical protein
MQVEEMESSEVELGEPEPDWGWSITPDGIVFLT